MKLKNKNMISCILKTQTNGRNLLQIVAESLDMEEKFMIYLIQKNNLIYIKRYIWELSACMIAEVKG